MTLVVEAWNREGQAWVSRFSVPDVSALAQEHVLSAEGGSTATASRVVARLDGGQLTERSNVSGLALQHRAPPGKKPFFDGRVDSASVATAATVRTEYSLECFVPLSLLASTGDEPTASEGADADTGLVLDERLQSSFCAQYVALR